MTEITDASPATATLQAAEASPRRLRYWTWGLPAFTAVWLAVYVSAFPDPAGLAARNWPLVLVGLAGAVLGNATAVGGGLVFIPVLMFGWQLGPVEALQLALVSQSVGMTSGAIGWLRRGAVPLRGLALTVPALLVGAVVGALVVRPGPLLIKGLFGPVSILVGLLTLYLLEHPWRSLEVEGRRDVAAVSLVGGLLTAWVAVGVGELVAAYLMLRHGLEPRRGIALGTVLLSAASILLALLHAFVIGGVPWELAVFTMLGCAWGGRLGPFAAQWVGPHRLKIAFATVAIGDGLLFVFQSLRSGW